jgi:hypothetical protein
LSGTPLPDGLTAMRDVIQLSEVMRLIEHTARWVDPETFRLLPLWYPEHARRTYFYKMNWSEPQMNKNRQTGHTEHKREGNLHANKALTHALGLRSDDRPNWSCCHIWGIDDAQYQEANAIVQDRRFFSCVANMVLLPTPLKAFTDTMWEVKAMLRIITRVLRMHSPPSRDGRTGARIPRVRLEPTELHCQGASRSLMTVSGKARLDGFSISAMI